MAKVLEVERVQEVKSVHVGKGRVDQVLSLLASNTASYDEYGDGNRKLLIRTSSGKYERGGRDLSLYLEVFIGKRRYPVFVTLRPSRDKSRINITASDRYVSTLPLWAQEYVRYKVFEELPHEILGAASVVKAQRSKPKIRR
jgi:hypothetical protein